jgi:hypothetical protein
MWVRPGVVAQFAGVTVTGPDGVRVVGRQTSPRAIGDRTIFALAAEEGTAAASALPTGFPVPPGAQVVRSAVYRDSSASYRSAVVSAPLDIFAASAWYRTGLAQAGWAVDKVPVGPSSYRFQPIPVTAHKDGETVHLEFAPGSVLGEVRRSGLEVSAPPTATVVGILISAP